MNRRTCSLAPPWPPWAQRVPCLAPGRALALGADASTTLIGAAWRGLKATDTHYVQACWPPDWERKKLSIRYAVALPSRPHGPLPQADGARW